MTTAVKIRRSIIACGAIGFGTYFLYKLVTPSNEETKPNAKRVVREINMDEGQPSGPGAGAAIGNDPTSRSFGRVIELSKQGYSYEAITKIIGGEQKRRYQALYAREEYERKQALEARRAAERSKFTLPTIDTSDVIDNAVQAIIYSNPTSKT